MTTLLIAILAAQDARAALADALRATLKDAGVELQGTVNPVDTGTPVTDSGGVTWTDFSVRIGKGGTIALTASAEKCRLEAYIEKGRRACRFTWSGPEPIAGLFLKESASLANLAAVADAVATCDAVEAKGEESVDGATCKVFKADLPVDLVETSKDNGDWSLELRVVPATFYIKEGRLHSAAIGVEYRPGGALALDMGPDAEKIRDARTYRLRVTKIDAALDVTVPEDLKPFLKE